MDSEAIPGRKGEGVRTAVTAWGAVLALSLPLRAQDADSPWRLSGFGTLGLVSNSNELGEFRRDLSQPRGAAHNLDPRVDSRLGLQLNLDLRADLSFVGQVVSSHRYDHTFTPDLSWAFLSWTPASGLQIRAGRLGWDVFHLADTRNVGYAYPWVRPPQDFYGTLLFSNLDGADVAWRTPIGEGRSLRFKVSAGRASGKLPLDQGGRPVDVSGTKLFGTLAEFQGESLHVRVAYARARTARDFPLPVSDLQNGLNAYAALLNDPGLARQADALGISDRPVNYYSAGLGWQKGGLQVEAVGAQIRSRTAFVPDFESGYVSAGYRLGAVLPYVLASRVDSDRATPYVGALPSLGPEAAALAGAVTRMAVSSWTNQSTLSLGFRWDFHPKAAFKAQVDRVSARPDGSLLWARTDPGWDGKATVLSAVLDFVF